MKLILVILIVSLSTLAGFSQTESKVSSAINYIKTGELNKAKQAIDEATAEVEKKNSEINDINTNNFGVNTSDQAKVWFARGVVYHSLYESKDTKYNLLCDNALEEAYQSYLKTNDLDKEKLYNADVTGRLKVASTQFKSKGVAQYKEYKYKEALQSFENSLAINGMPMCIKLDTTSYYYAALSAEKSNSMAKAKQYYLKLIDISYGGSKVFLYLAKIYATEKNYEASDSTLKKGLNLYPKDNSTLLNQLINNLIEEEKNTDAMNYLKTAIEKEPGNASFHFVLGSMYDQQDKYTEAESAYKKALEIKPDYADALNKLGLLYYNKAIMYNEEVNQLTDQNQYKAEKEKVNEYFQESLPYLEKALTYKPKDSNVIKPLKFLYERFEMTEKLNELKKNTGVK